MEKCAGTTRHSIAIRKFREGDAIPIRRIYHKATQNVCMEGVAMAILKKMSVWVTSLFSCICLLKNWWILHVIGYLLFLCVPYIASHIILRILDKSDIMDPVKYFSVPKTALFVAEVDGRVVGMVGMKPAKLDVEGKFKGLRKEGDAELVRMNILPDYQGMGISKRLMDTAIEFARNEGFRRIVLSSATYRHVATYVLYPKYGFIFEKEVPGFLGINPVFMSKILSE